MKNKIMAVVLVTTLILSSLVSNAGGLVLESSHSTEVRIVNESYGDENTYQVILPENYDSNTNYPSIYMMPIDGLSSQQYVDDGIKTYLDETLGSDQAIEMIVIMPDYSVTDDFTALLQALVDDVEAKYSVIQDASYRGILGVGVGGYMAYASVLLDVDSGALFTAVGSHMGNFKDHIWSGKGSVYDAVSVITANEMKKKYYYIDGPNGDLMTTREGSTSDIGSIMMQKTNPYYGTQWVFYATPNTNYVEYSIRHGQATKEFYLESLQRSLNRFSTHFTKGLITGNLSLSPQAVTSSDNTIDASIELTLSDVITKYKDEVPTLELSVTMLEPSTQDVLYKTSVAISISPSDIDENITQHFELERSYMSSGINTTVMVQAKILGMIFDLSTQSLVNVQDTGTADDEQLIDMMGNWYFNAYKDYVHNDTETVTLDYIENIDKDIYENWDVVQPGMGWWKEGFASSLKSATSATYAWYIREFELPNDFSKEGLLMAVGKSDEADEVFINGIRIGSTGYDYTISDVGVYDRTNPWDVNSVYDIDTNILKYGETNTIAVRICNSSGGGGWYEGPIGLYSRAAYNKVLGKPSIYASDTVATKVMTLVEQQKNAIEAENIAGFIRTISYDFFDSGYDKERKVNEIQGWINNYSEIVIIDNDGMVFVDGDLYVYVAQRLITAKDSEGVEQIIFEGEINQYYDVSNGSVIEYGNHSRFFLDTYITDAIDGSEQELTVRVYLPEGYFNSQKRYKTSYLFHGINSSSKTFEIDKIDQVLDKNIADGLYEEMIVILPDDPTKTSFWRDGYADMITEDLIPTVDQRYRTIADARFRFTAGCSMGGAGSFGIGLTNPNLFSGAISFYGALTYNNILTNTGESTSDYLSRYAIFMASGNQDNYNFYDIAGKMSRVLNDKEVEHYLYIDNGGHDTEFYLPLFDDAYSYMENNMYQVDVDDTIINGNMSLVEKGSKLQVTYNLSVDENINNYLDVIEESEFTMETNPDIVIPMVIAIEQNENVIYTTTQYFATKEATQWSDVLSIDNSDFDMTKKYTVKMYASILNKTKLVSERVVQADNYSSPTDSTNNNTITSDPKDETIVIREQIFNAIDNANKIVIVVDLPKGAQSVEIKLDKDSFNKMAESKTESFTIQMSIGSIIFDLKAIESINRSVSGDLVLSINKSDVAKLTPSQKEKINAKAVYDITLSADKVMITDFGAGVVTVKLPYTVESQENKHSIVIYYIDLDGNIAIIPNCQYDEKEEKVYFKTNHFSTFVIANNQVNFSDTEEHWAKESINFTASRGIFSGIGNEMFAPNMAMTRGMFVTVLSRLAGVDLMGIENESSFEDVNPDAYYAKAILWASQEGIINGVGPRQFAPDQDITRAQMAVILYNYYKTLTNVLEIKNLNKTFADEDSIPKWAAEAVNKMQEMAIIEGKPGNLFDSQSPLTRGETSTVIRRFIESIMSN